MEALYKRFGPRGLVILAISDEDIGKVEPFIAAQKYTYPFFSIRDGRCTSCSALTESPRVSSTIGTGGW